jgi:hypothetical protein
MGLHDLVAYSIYRVISGSAKAMWRRLTIKRCRHGVPGGCAGCQADQEERKRDDFAGSPERIRLTKQKELDAIYAEYYSIEEGLRESFKSRVEDRVRRYDLKYGPGDLESAVLRMYRARFEK